MSLKITLDTQPAAPPAGERHPNIYKSYKAYRFNGTYIIIKHLNVTDIVPVGGAAAHIPPTRAFNGLNLNRSVSIVQSYRLYTVHLIFYSSIYVQVTDLLTITTYSQAAVEVSVGATRLATSVAQFTRFPSD